mmetsp:Transcript_15390/g.30379  ORF Transcript_15390/g.30379 Transcript_15390/m.30379 type:complete len:269 (-) Transcript_15390:58-864(-)
MPKASSIEVDCGMSSSKAGAIRVIGAGLGRTGTKSLQAALEKLGYKTYHFPLPAHAGTWAKFAEGTASSDEVLDMIAGEGYTATCDQPTADLYLQQLNKYPDAKVVLTVRDSGEKWAASWKVLMRFIAIQERPFSLLYPTFIQWIPFMRAWKRMRDIMGTHLGLPPGMLIRGWSSQPDPESFLAAQYEKHNAQVRERVPRARLLEFNVKEGWGPLCEFLGKDVPEGGFPHVNESAELETASKVMTVVSYIWLPALTVSAALLITALRP